MSGCEFKGHDFECPSILVILEDKLKALLRGLSYTMGILILFYTSGPGFLENTSSHIYFGSHSLLVLCMDCYPDCIL